MSVVVDEILRDEHTLLRQLDHQLVGVVLDTDHRAVDDGAVVTEEESADRGHRRDEDAAPELAG